MSTATRAVRELSQTTAHALESGGDAFLSYSRDNKTDADCLIKLLAQHGKTIAIDLETLRVGDEWRRKVVRMITGSHAFIVLISPDSMDASREVIWEIAEATKLQKKILPIVVGAVPDDAIPQSMHAFHRIDATTGINDAIAKQVVDAIETDQEWAEFHTKLISNVLEYELNGAVLTVRQQKAAQRMIATYAGKRPLPTADQHKLIAASRKATARRRWILGGVIVVTTAVVATLGLSSFIEQRNATYVGLRRDGERALTTFDSGDVAGSMRSLATIVRADAQNILPEYVDILRFWNARFVPLDELATEQGTIVEAPTGNFLHAGSVLQRLPVEAPFFSVTLPPSRLLVAQTRSVAILDSSARELLRLDFPFRVTPRAVYAVPGKPWFLFDSLRLQVSGDEDEPQWNDECFGLVVTDGSGAGAQVFPTDDFAYEDHVAQVGVAAGSAGDSASAFCMYKMFRGFRLTPTDSELIIEGVRDNYDDNGDTYEAMRIPIAGGAPQFGNPESHTPYTEREYPPALPENRRLRFPATNSERDAWQIADFTLASTAGALMERASDCEERVKQAIDAVDLSGVEEPATWRESLTSEQFHCGEIAQGTGMRVWATSLRGNATLSIISCHVDTMKYASDCKTLDFNTEAATMHASPDRRWVAQRNTHSEDATLELVDIERMERLTLDDEPPEIVAAGTFSPTSTRYAAFTAASELLLYDLARGAAPKLVGRTVIDPQDTSGAELVFATDSTLIVGRASGSLVGVDTETLTVRWRRSSGGDSTTLVQAEGGPFFATGAPYRVYHATTGTPLSDALDDAALTEMLGNPNETYPSSAAVASDGTLAVRIGTRLAVRPAPTLTTREDLAADFERRTASPLP
jgi:hypothetical protein